MSRFTSYCWVRVLSVSQPASDPLARVVVNVPGLQISDGGRPPSVVQSIAASAPTAQAAPHRFWSAQRSHFGPVQADTVFDFGPAFDDEADAVGWITTPEGETWSKQAVNFMLIKSGESSMTPQPPEKGQPSEFDDTKGTPDIYKFRADDWSIEASSAHLPARNPALLLLRSLDSPSLVCGDIVHDQTRVEAAELLRKQEHRTTADEELIQKQAQGQAHVIQSILAKADIDHELFAGPDGKELIDLVTDTVQPVVFINKRRFMRARPVHVFPRLRPMFRKTAEFTDRLYPGHPSYPSSHSTMAYVWAYLLQACGADPRGVLPGIAGTIASNRELAGVHFSSDTDAGRELARVIVGQMLDPATNANHGSFIQQLWRLRLEPSLPVVAPFPSTES